MPRRNLRLTNEHGLHARPASVFAQAAAKYPCRVTVGKDGREVNAKSVLSVLTLDCHKGDELVISTDGEQAEEALAELVALVESGLGE